MRFTPIIVGMNTTSPTLIEVKGRFDVHRLDDFRGSTRGADAVLLDMAETDFIDTHALNALAELDEALAGALVLAGPAPVVQITLELTGRSLRYFASRTEAQEALTMAVAA